MKILHLCLANYYAENCMYQENQLTQQNIKDGHDVLVIASTVTFSNGKVIYAEPGLYNDRGVKIIRLSYRKLPRIIKTKLGLFRGLKKNIEEFNPDLIMFHGTSSLELFTVKKYIQSCKNTPLIVDCHADQHNSGKNILSKYILHKGVYRFTLWKNLKVICKVLCISPEVIDFCLNNYRLPEKLLEFYPLGGDILCDENYNYTRNKIRNKYDLKDEILLVHSGKFTKEKRTIDLLRALKKIENRNIKCVLAGVVMDETMYLLDEFKKDDRLNYIGWISGDDLTELLCGADIYIQPGSQSSTLETAICCRCAVICENLKSLRPFVDNNGFLINGEKELFASLNSLLCDIASMEEMGENSHKKALKMLDYKILANRMYKIMEENT